MFLRLQDMQSDEKCTSLEEDHISDVSKIIQHLPSWVRSDMVYHEDAIEIQQLLGRGHYGCVYKGLFRNGKAVYVNK